MIKRLTANVALWLMAIGIASFAILYMAVGQNPMIEISSGLLLGAQVMLFLSFFLAALYAVATGSDKRGDILIVGLCAGGLFGATRQGWTFMYRWLDRPDAMLDHWSYPLILYSCFWAVGLMVLAPGTERGHIPTPNKIHLVVAAVIGALVGGIAIGFSLSRTGF